jgi:hypothetical protein
MGISCPYQTPIISTNKLITVIVFLTKDNKKRPFVKECWINYKIKVNCQLL